jgi:DNA-binding response OmpR family regulator
VTQTSPIEKSPTASPTVLVIDDEPTIRETIAYTLRREGFTVETAAEGTRALAIARERKPDLIVLDIMLPGMDGLQFCRVLRRESAVPIVMLSARGEEVDRVVGLEIGADDYLTKPFAMRELVARIRAQLRRVQFESTRVAGAPSTTDEIEIGDLRIDRASHRVTVAGSELALKPMEYELLVHLVSKADRVLSRAQLLKEVWGYDVPIETRTVDVHVRWLRMKLSEHAGRVPTIATVRGIGYRLSLPARSSPGAVTNAS